MTMQSHSKSILTLYRRHTNSKLETTFEDTQQFHGFFELVKLFLLPTRFLCRNHISLDSALP